MPVFCADIVLTIPNIVMKPSLDDLQGCTSDPEGIPGYTTVGTSRDTSETTTEGRSTKVKGHTYTRSLVHRVIVNHDYKHTRSYTHKAKSRNLALKPFATKSCPEVSTFRVFATTSYQKVYLQFFIRVTCDNYVKVQSGGIHHLQ